MTTPQEFVFLTQHRFIDTLTNEPEHPVTRAVSKVAGGGGARSFARKALTCLSLPKLLFSRRRWTQSAYSQDTLTTLEDGTQYVVFLTTVGSERHWFIAKREGGSRKWETFDLATASRGFWQEPRQGSDAKDDDSHNVVCVWVSADGHVHVIGNMHSVPMRYVRTTVPGDITSFQPATVANVNTDKVTYPMFFGVNGKTFLAWRNGLATEGDFFIAQYTGSGFTTPRKLLDGASTGRGAYLHRIAVRDGKVSIFFMYRGSGDASTNEGLFYAESVDECQTWRRSTGAAQATPITPANGERFMVIPEKAGLLNQGGADIDIDGYPHAAIQLYDAAGNTQLHHVWRDVTGWHSEQVTEWTQRVETVMATTLDLKVARPHLFCTDAGRTYMLARTSGEGYNNAPLLIDVTPGADHEPVVLADLNLYGWEPAIDSRALRERNELNMLITPIDVNADSKQNWEAQWGGILSLDLAQIGAVRSGAVQGPSIRPVHTFTGPVSATIPVAADKVGQAVDVSSILGMGIIPATAYGPGARLFARVVARVTFSGGTTSAQLALREAPSTGSLPVTDLCKINVANATLRGEFETPWEPLPSSPYVELVQGELKYRNTRLIPMLTASHTDGATIQSYVIEVGILAGV